MSAIRTCVRQVDTCNHTEVLMSSEQKPGEFVRALARGLSIIECFDTDHLSMSLTDVAKKTGLSRGTARRLLLTLENLGFVGSKNGEFSLKPKILKLGYSYLSTQPLWSRTRVFLRPDSQ